MKLLALDLGARKTGVAVAEGNFVFGRGVISGFNNFEKMVEDIKAIVNVDAPAKIIVGIPKSVSGEAEVKYQEVCDKIAQLTTLPVDVVDETLTTFEAKRRMAEVKNNGDDNEESAKIILENYLVQNNPHS